MQAGSNTTVYFKIATGFVLLPLVLVFLCSLSYAKSLVPPDDPTQSIVYWKPHAINATTDPLVSQAQAIFTVLLRAWDSARIEPTLYIVNSTAGPWAASLADGNILMSRDALLSINQFSKPRVKHLLAFVLAHELAHQRSDDLWHQRFFRLIATEKNNKILADLNFDKQHFDNIAEKEIQADHDSLLMMNSVGYDPYQVLDVVDSDDFFTLWVENIWQDSCLSQNTPNSVIKTLCEQAKSRALRARLQLTNVATQSILYDLGVQAFAAKNYRQSRRYFTAYGRDNTNRAVLSSIGLSYFAQALELRKKQLTDYNTKQANFYYPLLLDSTIDTLKNMSSKLMVKRGSRKDAEFKQINTKIQSLVEHSIRYYEKAVRLEPDHAKTYLLLAYSYLLTNNSFMVRGLIQGKYIPKFGQDSATDLILAMTQSIEGQQQEALKAFAQQIKNLDNNSAKITVLSRDLILYSVYYNSTALLSLSGDSNKAKKQWQQLASLSRQSGNSLLFQMALAHLKPNLHLNKRLDTAPTINGLRLGDKFSAKTLSTKQHKINDLWLDGELFHVYRFNDGSRYVIGANQKIISAWQEYGHLYLSGSKRSQLRDNQTADRPLKKFGIPDRRLHLLSGDYLAYDNYGMAIHVVQNKIAGWFLY